MNGFFFIDCLFASIPQTSMEIVQYLLVDWEQLSGDPPLITEGVVRSGTLLVKTTNLLGIQSWRQAFFVFK